MSRLRQAAVCGVLIFSLLAIVGSPARAEWIIEYRTENTRPSFLFANETTWFTGSEGGRSLIGEIDPSRQITKRFYFVNDTDLAEIALGPERPEPGSSDLSYVWFLQKQGGKIGRLNPRNNEMAEWLIPTPNSKPTAIVIHRYGNGAVNNNTIFFTEQESNKIGSLRYVGGQWVFKEFLIPTENSKPIDIAVDNEGYLWFSESDKSKIGKLDPWKGQFSEYSLVEGSQPWGITIDRDNSIWFAMSQANKIGRMNPRTGWYDAYDIPTSNSRPRYVETDLRGNVWFTEFDSGKIGRFLPNNTAFVEYRLPDISAGPDHISITRSTGEVWVTEILRNKIVRIMPAIESPASTATKTSALETASSTASTATVATVTLTASTKTTAITSISTWVTTITAASTMSITVTSTTSTTQSASTATSVLTITVTAPAPKQCVIASVAYGSQMAAPVNFLREHRDNNVLPTFAGSQFMRVFERFYYSFSSDVAEILRTSEHLRVCVRLLLSPLIHILRISTMICSISGLNSEIAVFLSGTLACSLIGITYVMPITLTPMLLRGHTMKERADSHE